MSLKPGWLVGAGAFALLQAWAVLPTSGPKWTERARGQAGEERPYAVRIAYIVPRDRNPRAEYRAKIARTMALVQRYYADQMEANGFGRMTFQMEKTKSQAVEVHLIRSQRSVAEIAQGKDGRYESSHYWENALDAFTDGGFEMLRPGEVWVIFLETGGQNLDGTPSNTISAGADGFESGICVNRSTVFELSDPATMRDGKPYDGRILPALGPFPLRQGISYPPYEGTAVNAIAGMYVGSLAHEMGHAFRLEHCMVNDETSNGNLMGNGCRAFRGYLLPHSCPNEDMRLDRASALSLRVSPFFGAVAPPSGEGEEPKVTITTPPGAMKLQAGKVRLDFTVRQENGPGIVLATLENGIGADERGVVAWKSFSGRPSAVADSFVTSDIVPGTTESWRVRVFDAGGNVGEATVKLQAPSSHRIGAIPTIAVLHQRVQAGNPVRFLGGLSRPARPGTFAWTFGDGEGAKGQNPKHTFRQPGLFEVKLKATDALGTSENSMFMRVAKNAPEDLR